MTTMFNSFSELSFNGDREEVIKRYTYRFGKRDGFAVVDNEKESYIFLEPVFKVWADANGSYVKDSRGLFLRFQDPWEAFQKEISTKLNQNSIDINCPNVSGYFSYEFLHSCEEILKAKVDDHKVPYYVFYIYQTVLKLPKQCLPSQCSGSIVSFNYESTPLWKFSDVSSDVFHNQSELANQDLKIDNSELKLLSLAQELEDFSNFSQVTYEQAVSEIIKLIHSGEVYQVNLSQQFILPYFGRPEAFAVLLRSICPSNHSAYLSVRAMPGFEGFQVVSASPELFFVCDGTSIKCSPIKGTRRRGQSVFEDQVLADELISSEKDKSELTMIVDLVRNDLSKIAETGSVRVSNPSRIETLPNVHHLVADVKAKLTANINFDEIIKALFPCGSITGAPKIAAMKIIAKIEGCTRGVYTGAIGVLGVKGRAEFNVAIRTAMVRDGYICVSSGGGVVFDSNPTNEYFETIAKVRAIYSAIRAIEQESYEDLAPIALAI
jgi:para-aminobenzoate synthetase component I